MINCLFKFYIFYSLLIIIKSSWIDIDTIDSNKITKSYNVNDNDIYELVFSDEFNVNDRTFDDGNDPRWTAIHKNDYTNYALHYYNKNLVKTKNGYLNISTVINDIELLVPDDKSKTGKKKLIKNYQSGMLQGWNKFCFTGGIIEFSAQLPGDAFIGGMWPALWLLGNLVRATYVSSSNNVWPWSYNECNSKLQSQQLFSACNVVNHFSLHSKQGRGAPEIDILEVMPGHEKLINTPINKPYLSTSLQVAPGIQDYRPVTAQLPAFELWYNHGLVYGLNSSLNIFFYGMHLDGVTKERSYLADAISSNTNLDQTYFNSFHNYRVEWDPSEEGSLTWYIDGILRFSIDSSALNITGARIPNEPMYIILNTAISSTWGFPAPCPVGCPCDCFDARREECSCAVPPNMASNFPAHFLIDYVRVYQNKMNPNHTVGCSTQTHPSKKYIKAHPYLFTEPDTIEYKNRMPLQPVQNGGLKCSLDISNQCGFGECKRGFCVCNSGFTGPNCKASVGFDDYDWDPEIDDISWAFMIVPTSLLMLSATMIILGILVIAYKYKYNINERGPWRLDKWLRNNYFGRSNIPYVKIRDSEIAMTQIVHRNSDSYQL